MKKRICIVEDDSDIRDLISYILMDDSYELQMCSSAKEFANVIMGDLPDVIVLDIMLPDGNGLELCREMKVRQSTSGIPIVLMSANFSQIEAMREECAKAFISKPFNIDHFKSTVIQYLNAS